MLAAVFSHQNIKLMVYRIPKRDAMISIPKRHGVEEGLWIVILELQLPGLPAINSFVDSRRRSITNAEQIGGVGVDRIDITEIEGVASDDEFLPGKAAIDR